MEVHIETYSSPGAFVRRAQPWLLEAEAEQNLLLGLGQRIGYDCVRDVIDREFSTTSRSSG